MKAIELAEKLMKYDPNMEVFYTDDDTEYISKINFVGSGVYAFEDDADETVILVLSYDDLSKNKVDDA